MARIRSVHPSLFTDEAWVGCSPLARILYVGLMCEADDQGLFEWKPLQIKMRLLPADPADVPALLGELAEANLIAALDAGGKRLGAIRYFRRFQRPKKPNAVFVLPLEWRTYVGLSSDGSELADDDEGAVPNQFPTSGESPPQMEDGGGKKEEKSEDADASSSSARKRRRPVYPASFEVAWKAYPHVEGRSSKTDTFAEWERLPADEQSALTGCIERFRPNVAKVCGDKGAPCMSRWLKGGKHLAWLGAPDVEPEANAWTGPEKVLRILVAALGKVKAHAYLAQYCTWQDLPFEALIVSHGHIAKIIRDAAGSGFRAEGIAIDVKGRAA